MSALRKDLEFMANLPKPGGDRALIKVLTLLAVLVVAALVFWHCH
jgi:hypothetical protein